MARNRIVELRNVAARELQADPRNWRKHPKRQRATLRTMLERIGYVDAVIARETPDGLMLIDGHLRADLSPDVEIPVLVVDLDEAEAGEVLATLDPLAAMAETDTKALQSLVSGLASQADEALRGLLGSMHRLPGTAKEEEPLAEEPEPKAERGQVWQLGRHRLMCGDSTSAEDVARLLDGAKPYLTVTNPPYGVNYDPQWRTRASEKGSIKGHVRRGDYIEVDRCDWVSSIALGGSSVYYIWCASLFVDVIKQSMESMGIDVRTLIVWKKQHWAISRGHYQWQHETCWYGVKKGRTAKWTGGRNQSTVWEIASLIFGKGTDPVDQHLVNHAAQKPIECMERPIRNHEGDVYDPFVGSGTTLIAAERQGRTCYAMEIEPRFIDTCIARWEQYTGGVAQQVPQ